MSKFNFKNKLGVYFLNSVQKASLFLKAFSENRLGFFKNELGFSRMSSVSNKINSVSKNKLGNYKLGKNENKHAPPPSRFGMEK